MNILFFFIFLKIFIAVVFLTITAMLAAEFFPQIADWAVASTAGTSIAIMGVWFSKAMMFFASLASKFVTFIFHGLEAVGLKMGTMRDLLGGSDSAKKPS